MKNPLEDRSIMQSADPMYTIQSLTEYIEYLEIRCEQLGEMADTRQATLEWKDLELKECQAHLRWFCHRRDMGQIRSDKTYARFRALLKKQRAWNLVDGDDHETRES